MLKKGWNKPNVSLYGSPVLFIWKKTGELHRFLCTKCQYKAFFFLPRIADFLDKLGKTKYFSSIYLATAYL